MAGAGGRGAGNVAARDMRTACADLCSTTHAIQVGVVAADGERHVRRALVPLEAGKRGCHVSSQTRTPHARSTIRTTCARRPFAKRICSGGFVRYRRQKWKPSWPARAPEWRTRTVISGRKLTVRTVAHYTSTHSDRRLDVYATNNHRTDDRTSSLINIRIFHMHRLDPYTGSLPRNTHHTTSGLSERLKCATMFVTRLAMGSYRRVKREVRYPRAFQHTWTVTRLQPSPV